ncbi:MAG TPA: hypothetical protein VHV30_11925 [Polyangiaceae bacterium]|jgi:serine/threonine-protein kinase|nr:hypothetical protein [Polyangiaceae bacterium]
MRSPLRSPRILAAGVSVALVALAAGPARAQTPQANNNVAAEALFEEARNLVAAGKFAEACPKFAESERLGPSVSTLLNLGNCWEKAARTATAWATYREAASAANATGRKDYQATAQRRADNLAGKLARLTITVGQPVAGLQVKRDGVAVDAAEYNVGIPVDTGSHAVEASAPGKKTWSVSVDVTTDGSQQTVTVPPLEDAPPGSEPAPVGSAPAAPEAAPQTAAAPASSSAPVEEPGRGNGQRVAGGVIAGVGVAGLVVGGIFALSAKSKYNDSVDNCQAANHDLCNATGVSQRNDARSAGNVATVFLGVGAAALVGGAIVFFAAPHGGSTTGGLQVMPTLGGVVARGAF